MPDGKGIKDMPILPNARQLPMVDGQLAAEAQWVTRSEKLIAERPVGNGRMCMSTISLSDDLLVRWKSYASMVNAALLRHPARNWRAVDALSGEMVWWHEEGREGDSSLSTRFRLFSRVSKRNAVIQSETPKPTDGTIASNSNNPPSRFLVRSVGSWNDDSSLAVAAADSWQPHRGSRSHVSTSSLNCLRAISWCSFH